MAVSWKLVAHADKATIEAALATLELRDDWPADIVVSGHELAEDRPDEWVLEAWMPERPGEEQRALVRSLFAADPPRLQGERLADVDWVVESQKGVDPIRAGRFRVRTPDHPAGDDADAIEFVIPASQAFGTGQHETTAGCLAMLDTIRAQHAKLADIADIGTGTGLLAFAARALWPEARVTASDIDPVCEAVVRENGAINGVPIGDGPRQVSMIVADGMEDPRLEAATPFDLLIANILAQPLIDMAPAFDAAIAVNGHCLLAGLLETQEPAVRKAYAARGLALRERLVRGDWSILWLSRQA